MSSQQIRLGIGLEKPRREIFLEGRLEALSARGIRGPDRVLIDALGIDPAGRVLVVGSREGPAGIALAKLR